MKKARVLLIIVLVIFVLPLIGYVGWLLKKGHYLEVVVVNKSMTHFRGSENSTMNYILNSEKIVTEGGRSYDLKVDHIGLLWNKGDFRINYPRLKDVPRSVEKADLVYYADVSGIMSSQVKKLNAGAENQLEYGGLNNTDYTFVRELISKGTPLILECSFFGYPTASLVRYNIEKLCDVYYVGWHGKYIPDLTADVEDHDLFDWKKTYEEFTGMASSFSGSGIVMINKEAQQIVVLEEEIHISTLEGLLVSTKKASDTYGLAEHTNYYGWFTLLHPGRNMVLSEFVLNATEAGKQLLNEAGIPENFPALIMTDNNCYFMAGDFGKCKVNASLSKVALLRPLYDWMKRKSKKSSNFFYSYYQPFMTSLIDEAKENHSDNE